MTSEGGLAGFYDVERSVGRTDHLSRDISMSGSGAVGMSFR